MTFYDFLEEMMMKGILLATDQVSKSEEQLSPEESVCYSNKRLKRSSKIQGQEEMFVIDDLGLSPRSQKSCIKIEGSNRSTQNDSRRGSHLGSPLVTKGCNSNNIFSPCSNLLSLQDFEQAELDLLVENIERRCLDLAQQIGYRYLTDAAIQREVAYLIVCLARRDNGIVHYENDLLRELYGIQIRNISDFHSKISKLVAECPDFSNQLLFDLVIRQYTSSGREIVPPFFQKQIEKEQKALAEMDQREAEKKREIKNEKRKIFIYDKKPRKSCGNNPTIIHHGKKIRRSYNPINSFEKSRNDEQGNNSIKIRRQTVNIDREKSNFLLFGIEADKVKKSGNLSKTKVKRVGVKVDRKSNSFIMNDLENQGVSNTKAPLSRLIQNHRIKAENRSRCKSKTSTSKKIPKIKVNIPESNSNFCFDTSEINTTRDIAKEIPNEWLFSPQNKPHFSQSVLRERPNSPPWKEKKINFKEKSQSFKFNQGCSPMIQKNRLNRHLTQHDYPIYQDYHGESGGYVSPQSRYNQSSSHFYGEANNVEYSPYNASRIDRNSIKRYSENQNATLSPILTTYDSGVYEQSDYHQLKSVNAIKSNKNQFGDQHQTIIKGLNDYPTNSPLPYAQRQQKQSPSIYDYNAISPSQYNSMISDYNPCNRSQVGYNYQQPHTSDIYPLNQRMSRYKARNRGLAPNSPRFNTNYNGLNDQTRPPNSSPYHRNSRALIPGNKNGNNLPNTSGSPLGKVENVYPQNNLSRQSVLKPSYIPTQTFDKVNSTELGRNSMNAGNYYQEMSSRNEYNNIRPGSAYKNFMGEKNYYDNGMGYGGLAR